MVSFNLVEGAPLKSLEVALAGEMDKPLKFFEKELAKIRTGRAHTSLVEDIKVSSYGSLMPLKQVAAISAPEVTLVVIQPWDKTLIPEIEKAIASSDLGVTPVNDGTVIRVTLPKLSTQRREELVKGLGKKLEETKIALRTIRKDFHNVVREAEKNKKISEDYSKRVQDVLQKSVDKAIETADKMSAKKEDEIRTI